MCVPGRPVSDVGFAYFQWVVGNDSNEQYAIDLFKSNY